MEEENKSFVFSFFFAFFFLEFFVFVRLTRSRVSTVVEAQKSLCFLCDVDVRHRRPISALSTPSTWVWWMIWYLCCVYFSNGEKAHTSDVCRLCTRQQMKSSKNLCENRSTKVEFSILFHPFDSGPLWLCMCLWMGSVYIIPFFFFSRISFAHLENDSIGCVEWAKRK